MRELKLPPVVGSIDSSKIVWKAPTDIDFEWLGYLLSCHWIIEHFIDHHLRTGATEKLGWDDARLQFFQKLALMPQTFFNPPYTLVPSIKHLNALRNRFVHRLDTTLAPGDLDPFINLLRACHTGDYVAPEEPIEVLGEYTSLVCAFLAGALAGRRDADAGKFSMGTK